MISWIRVGRIKRVAGCGATKLITPFYMGRVVIHKNPDPERLEMERAKAFLGLPIEEKLKRLFALIDLSVKLNNGQPIKQPQGKGIVIRKPQ